MSELYPDGNIDIPVDSLLNYAVSMSDNIACDMLFKTGGGTEKVNAYIHSLGVTQIAIQATEEAMHKDWPTQYTNWCEPTAMVQLLDIFYKKTALSDSSHALLWRLMVNNKTGDDRIRGLLPKGTIVGDKTGTGGTKDGIASATNDIGIIVLPNGHHLAIVVYVSDAKASVPVNKAVIAKIAKAAYDAYNY
jgi:beta-lactamase class A